MSDLQDHDSLRSSNFATILHYKAIGLFYNNRVCKAEGTDRRDIFARSAWASQARRASQLLGRNTSYFGVSQQVGYFNSLKIRYPHGKRFVMIRNL